MLVHADQAGDHGGAGEVEELRAGGRLDAAHGRDLAVVDDDGLVFERRGAGAIDDAHVLQRNHGSVDRHERLDAGHEAALGKGGEGKTKEDAELHQGIVAQATGVPCHGKGYSHYRTLR